MLYNHQIKNEYLKTLKNQTAVAKATRVFIAVEEQEARLKQDVAEMEMDTLLAVLRYSIGIQYVLRAEIQRATTIILHYLEWIRTQNKFFANLPTYRKITVDEIDCDEIYPYKFFKNGNQLLNMLSKIFDMKNYTSHFGFVLGYLLLFNGIPLASMSQIRRVDVNFEHNIIQFNYNHEKNQIKMIPEFVNLYKQSMEMTEYHGILKKKYILNTDLFLPLSSDKGLWHTSFTATTNKIIKSKQNIIQNNLSSKEPIFLEQKLLRLNGTLYRTYLSSIYDCSFFSNIDTNNKQMNLLYQKFINVFYPETARSPHL